MHSLKLSALLVLLVTTIVSMSAVVNGAGEDYWFLLPDQGFCGDYIRYYYNGLSNSCETFYYGGRGGNSNNFR